MSRSRSPRPRRAHLGLAAVGLVVGLAACQPTTPTTPTTPTNPTPTKNPADDRVTGSAHSGVVSVTGPSGTAVNVGQLAYQGLPCNPTLSSTFTNATAKVDTTIPVAGGKVTLVNSGTTTNTGTVRFDHAKATSDVVESSKVEGLSLLDGLVTADVVQAKVHLSHAGTVIDQHKTDGTTGTVVTNLRIGGLPVLSVPNPAPNTTLALPGGIGSITLNEITPVPAFFGDPAGLAVNAIHIKLGDLAGIKGDIIVGHAQAGLGGASDGRLNAGGYLASASVAPVAWTGFIGAYGMGCSGTSGPQTSSQVGITLPVVGSLGTGKVTVDGTVKSTGVAAKSVSTVQAVDLLDGTITADALTASASSTADGGGIRSSGTGSQFANLVIAGRAIPLTVPPNTKIDLPGVGYVVLNEQSCGSDTAGTPSACTATHRTTIDVNALHLKVTVANQLGLPVGAEVILAHADSGASR